MDNRAYFQGRTPYIACQADPRFAYCLYVPPEIHRLCVYVHGTDRDAAFYRDQLVAFADATQSLILAPLFPAGLIEPEDVSNYKMLLFHDIRFDRVLLHMVDEVRARYDLPAEPFLLGGFSGGAQFAQRFYYLHPRQLIAVSLAAPGRVTLLDSTLDWWPGTRNVESLFGQDIDLEALCELPLHLTVGAADCEDYRIPEDSTAWAQGANKAGNTRVERLNTLYEHYQQLGIPVRRSIVAGAAHEPLPLMAESINFFENVLKDLP